MFSEKPPKNDVKPETHCSSGNLAGPRKQSIKTRKTNEGT